MVKPVVLESNFVCNTQDGYVYERIWGRISVAEAEKSAAAVIKLAAESGHRKFLCDIDGLNWINDMAVRRRGLELMYAGSKAFDRIALVSKRGAIIYMVSALARGGGITVKGFDTQSLALAWLMAEAT